MGEDVTLPCRSRGLSNGVAARVDSSTDHHVKRPLIKNESLLTRIDDTEEEESRLCNNNSSNNALSQSTFGKLGAIEEDQKPPPPSIANIRSVSLPDIIDSATVKISPVLKFQPGNKEGGNWLQRKERIESALVWVRSELNFIRAQDKVLLSQLQQCQDNIERLKRQRQQAAEQHGLQSLDDDTYWEDWEMSEFDMEDKKNFGQHSLDSRRFARSNPELSKSLLAAYSAKSSSIKKDLEIHV